MDESGTRTHDSGEPNNCTWKAQVGVNANALSNASMTSLFVELIELPARVSLFILTATIDVGKNGFPQDGRNI